MDDFIIEYDDLPVVPVGGSNDHDLLEHRDWANQHPTSAISELDEELADRPKEIITDSEILAL